MEDSTSVSRRIHVSESGRVLTSEEAALLRRCLLETKPADARSAHWAPGAASVKESAASAKDAS